jgi:hypothetical protein
MKMKIKLPFVLIALLFCGCSHKTPQQKAPVKDKTEEYAEYENSVFNLRYPKGWTVDDTKWNGEDSLQNEIDIYNPNGSMQTGCYIHCVKAYFPIQWKSAAEAAALSKQMKQIKPDPGYLGIYYEKDSLEVGGCPAYLIVYFYKNGNDTLINKQYVTLVKKTHTTLYFNNNFSIKNWTKGQELGDKIISTIHINNAK